jgi:hypothetical protein
MMKTLLVAATMATLIAGHPSRAQTVTLDGSSKMGRSIICNAQWKAIKDDPTKIELTKYRRDFFVFNCKKDLEKKAAGVR